MPENATVENLIEACVAAGVEAWRAHSRLLELEARHPRAGAAELAEALAESSASVA